MSTCISTQGEFGSHVLAETGSASERFVCSRCWVLDEDGVLAALEAAEAERDRAVRLLEVVSDDGPVFGRLPKGVRTVPASTTERSDDEGQR